MALIRFPQEPEFDHPQHLWNEQEFIIRMLNQHKIGIGIIENNTQATVTIQPGQSLNMVANGAVEFDRINNNLAFTANTNRMGWIYLAADGARFYLEPNLRPIYNQYLHGLYRNNGDRAVVFIDHEAPAGSRAMLMDSFNAHFEHEQRIPMHGGTLYRTITVPNSWQNVSLRPGSYRFEIAGGFGGRGGNASSILGGMGVLGQTAVLRINLYAGTTFTCRLGGNGNNGQDGRAVATPTGGANRVIAAGGGGGASGGDSRILGSNGSILLNAWGGSGGGGASAHPGLPVGTRATASPGGGGGGNGTAGNGGNAPSNIATLHGAHGGNGGQGGNNRLAASGVTYTWGQTGQSRFGNNASLFIRRGGDSGTISGFGLGPLVSSGATAAMNSSSGWFRIFQIRTFEGGEIS